MKHPVSAALLLSLALASPSFAADKKPKGQPSTLPPTSPMLVVPKPDAASADGAPLGKLISSEMSGRDLEFFTKTVDAGREQAFFVELLKKSARSEQIKKLAEALTATQEEENVHIAKLAAQKGWSVSLEPTAAQKSEGEQMEKLSGSNFDKAAMDKVVMASQQAQKAYEDAAQSTDPQIKTFAAQMLPLAEEKRHIVEKMTGAGSKTADQLFRHGGVSQGIPASTPAATPKGKGSPGKTIPSGSIKATSSAPVLELPVATPTPPPAALALPIATPPGSNISAPPQPPIIPSKTRPAPAIPANPVK